MKFKDYLLEQQEEYLSSALKWLKLKFKDKYKFKHQPNLEDYDKSYNCSIDDKEFTIRGRKYDTDGDGTPDTVLFKISPAEVEHEEF